MQSILIFSIAFLREQISVHGDEAHPRDGGLEYDWDNDLEILVRKMPGDPAGLDWSELHLVVAGLWEYIVTGMRYRTVTFDVLDIENDAQIGWGHIVKREGDSLSNRVAKRDLHLSSLAPPSSQRNSSLSTPLGLTIDWPIEDSDMSLRFTPISSDRGGRQLLDRDAVQNLLTVVIEIVQNKMATQGQEAEVGGPSFRYGRLIILEVINWPHMLTWVQLASVVLGLVDFIVDHEHYRSWYFTIFVHDPKVEIGFGKIMRGNFQHDNVTVARRSSVDGDGAD